MIDNESLRMQVHELTENIIKYNDELRNIENIEKSEYEINLINRIVELEKEKIKYDNQNKELQNDILKNGEIIRNNYSKLKSIRRELSNARKELSHYTKEYKDKKMNIKDLKKERRNAYNMLINFMINDMNSIR